MQKIPYSKIRRSITQYVRFAGRIFHPYISTEVKADQLEKYRLEHAGITYTPLLMKVIAAAVKKYPLMNGILAKGLFGGKIVIPEEVDICFAMEKTYRGETFVAIPAIRAVNEKSVQTIASEITDLANLPYEEFPGIKPVLLFHKLPDFLKYFILRSSSYNPKGFKAFFGTIGFSNLGKFGIHDFYPAWVNTTVFGVGSVLEKAVVDNGEIRTLPVLHLNLSFDHSVLDGAEAGRILGAVKELIENGNYDAL
jgi:pyruvate/2-oxoglutarate dehydrogenase complex dihydrolipoamide acyltransferase (E2) component